VRDKNQHICVLRDARILRTVSIVNMADAGNMFLKYMNVYFPSLYVPFLVHDTEDSGSIPHKTLVYTYKITRCIEPEQYVICILDIKLLPCSEYCMLSGG
jgi:hypothetical protein